MSRKLNYPFLFAAAISIFLSTSVDADLVGWWRFDEGSGSVASDSSGNGLDGAIEGAVWTDGQSGSALTFDGTDDAVRIPEFETGDAQTVVAWIKIDSLPSGQRQIFNGNGPPHMNFELTDGMIEGRVYTGSGNITLTGPEVPAGEWVHVTWVYDFLENRSELYINGVSVALGEATNTIAHTSPSVIGRHPSATTASFPGAIDDVRVYDSALSEGEIIAAMKGMPWPFAFGPSPKDGTMLEGTWFNLGWGAGDFAASHDLYFGTSFDDVNDGAEETYVGNLTKTNQIVGFPSFPAPNGLQPGTTYYWRVDEINDADPNSPWKGDVWSFWIKPRTAYNGSPADGATHVLQDVMLSWAAGMRASLHQVYFGDNLDDVSNASGAVLQQDTTYTTGTLEVGKTYYWRVDEFDSSGVTHTGNVWSFTTIPDIEVSDPNLLMWWSLDEGQGSNAVDWSGHGNNGAFVGEPKWVDGLYSSALEFSRDGEAVIYTLEDVDPNGWPAYTVAVWAKASKLNQAQWASVFNNNSNGDDFQIDVDGTSPGYYRFNAVGGSLLLGQVVKDWIHLAASCDGTSTTLYHNGDPVGTLGRAGHVFGQIAIGVNRGGSNSFFGVIDDMRVYNTALTEEQINDAMRSDLRLAHQPSPGRSEIVDFRDVSSLSWSKGDTVASHDVYFGTDINAVANADNSSPEFQGNQGGTSLSLAGLVEFGGGDYFWRVDEVEANGTVIAGTVWKFMVPDYLIVDNFESYNDLNEEEEGSNRIYLTWIDGYDNPTTNGAVAGNLDPPFMSQGHDSAQAMPVSYDNTGKTSEVIRTLTSKKDWTVHGVTKLSLWFRGDALNTPERIFVALNGIAVVYHEDPAVTQTTSWTEWVIDLTAFGVDLTNVSSITIGFGTKNTSGAGGTGTMHFDDISLIR